MKEERSLFCYNSDYVEDRSRSLSRSPVLTLPINASGFQGPDRRYKGSCHLGKEQNGMRRARGRWGGRQKRAEAGYLVGNRRASANDRSGPIGAPLTLRRRSR